MKRMKVAIKEIEYYLPDKSDTNESILADNPQWDMSKIFEKTGIHARRVSGKDECASDLGIKAAKELLSKSSFKKDRVDVLVFCTQSPDYFLPTTACIMQEKLGLSTSTAAFDINLGCSGYIYGLAVGASLIESGLYETALLVCADTYTKYIKKHDRTCRPVFADAGSATLLIKSEKEGIGPFVLGTDGKGAEDLIVAGGSARKREGKAVIKMDGAKIFMFTMSQIPRCIKELLRQSDKDIDEIDYFFFHQASKIVLDNIARHLSIPEEKIFRGYETIGNTVSSSIPIALKQASDEKKLKAGHNIVLAGFGVGYSWGACIIEWEGLGKET